MKTVIRAFIPAILMALAVIFVDSYSTVSTIMPPSISDKIPVGFKLDGWYGVKTQESEIERRGLAPDTKFSKAVFRQDYVPFGQKELSPVNISIIFSGKEMNNSIHQPEWCLPGQGHLDLQRTDKIIKMSNGKEYTFSRLTSYTKRQGSEVKLNHIHYYFFVSNKRYTHSHKQRNLYDIIDRIISSSVSSWAYLQVGSYWAPEMNISEEECDAHIQKLLSQLVPELMLNGL